MQHRRVIVGILQLSDIHLKGPNDRVAQRARAIAATINHFTSAELRLLMILVSGDIAWSGLPVRISAIVITRFAAS